MEIWHHERSTDLRNCILPSCDSPRQADGGEVQGQCAAPCRGVSYGEHTEGGSAKGLLSLDLGQLSSPDPPIVGES